MLRTVLQCHGLVEEVNGISSSRRSQQKLIIPLDVIVSPSDGDAMDASSDWNAPSEAWGNYEEPAANPAPAAAAQQVALPGPAKANLLMEAAVSVVPVVSAALEGLMGMCCSSTFYQTHIMGLIIIIIINITVLHHVQYAHVLYYYYYYYYHVVYKYYL